MAPGTIEAFVESLPWEELGPLLENAPADPATAGQQLRLYVTELISWNRAVSNLIAKNDEPRLLRRHVAESIEHAGWIAECEARCWIDFGSGAGFPAVPLAILGVGASWTLIEARRPKSLFLRKIISNLGLRSVDVVHGRLESIARDEHRRTQFRAFTSRATLPLDPTLELARSVVSPGGSAFLWKGSAWSKEIESARWRAAWDFVESRPLRTGPGVVLRFTRKSDR